MFSIQVWWAYHTLTGDLGVSMVQRYISDDEAAAKVLSFCQAISMIYPGWLNWYIGSFWIVLGFQIKTFVSSPPEATKVSDLFQHENINEFYELNKPWSFPSKFQTLAMLS